MKKLKKLSLLFGLLLGFTFIFNPKSSIADESPQGGGWVCCQNLSTGCLSTLGQYFPDDYKRYADTCTIGVGG
jgi:hypothetical protein